MAPGAERCFDEMCYSVKSITTAHTLDASPHPLTALGEFYIIAVQLRSAARGNAQKPSQPDLFVIDARGRRYSPAIIAGSETGLPIGQPVTAGRLWDQQIQPGAVAIRTVAFDLPAGVRQPGLVITEGIGPLSAIIIGDEGSFLHAKTQFRLTP